MSLMKQISSTKCNDEFGRQQALKRLNILDTPKEGPFEEIVDLVKSTLCVPICAVSLVDSDRQWFKAARGLMVGETCRSLAFCDYAIREPKPFVIPDAKKDERFAANPLVLSDPCIRAYAGIPLIMPDGYVIGTLCVMDIKPREFRQSDVDVLSGFARLVVGEIELRKTASVDSLTGALSRQAWRKGSEKEVERSARYASPLSVVLLDIDHFKKINDTYGHPVGDQVLSQISSAISQTVRSQDIFGRVGGEEFAIALPETDVTQAQWVAEKIRATISTMSFEASPSLECTISCGVAGYENGKTLDALMLDADSQLYRAKRGGRDQVCSPNSQLEAA